MTISTNQFKTGMAILFDGDLYLIVEYQHVKPGKGAAFVRTKLKSMKSGNVLSRTFDAGEKFQDAFIEKRPLQFQYRSGDAFHFMDLGNYEQHVFDAGAVGEAGNYLTSNLEVRGSCMRGNWSGWSCPPRWCSRWPNRILV